MKEFNKQIQKRFVEMCATGILFKSEITGDAVWDLYLAGFSPEDDPVFRDPASSTHNCNYCNGFIRRYGNVVALDVDLNIMTLFDNVTIDEYAPSASAIADCLQNHAIKDVFIETVAQLRELEYEPLNPASSFFRLGHAANQKRYTKEEADKFKVVKPNEIRTFNHFFLDLPTGFVDDSKKSHATIIAEHRETAGVFKTGITTIPLDTLILVKDLILQDSLLDGKAHLSKVERFIEISQAYAKIAPAKVDNWCWVASHKLNIARFKNELIGVLCMDLAQGMELNKACQTWNKRVDPVNYMRARVKPSEGMKQAAIKDFVALGYKETDLDRRFATIEDIKVSEILHINSGKGDIKAVSVFDSVKTGSSRHKKSEFNGVEEISIEKFMADILPSCTSVEAFLTSSHENNLVSLTTAARPEDGKGIFKWDNNYSWTYNGNLAGKSFIKEAVSSKGGRVDGVLRFSIIWNDTNGTDHSDLDAWCVQPNNVKIGFNSGYRKDNGNQFSDMTGQLDLDIQDPNGKLAVENIYFTDIDKMSDGKFQFYVNQYYPRGSQGFKAEIEFDGEIYNYEHNQPLRGNEKVLVAAVTLKNKTFSIEHLMPCTSGAGVNKEIYGLDTNKFHTVNLVCLSPNCWDKTIGNKNYFFMLDGCKADSYIKGFHAENLIPELVQHRKVLDIIADATMIEPGAKQLSGLGFNATVRDSLVVRLKGSFQRVVKINF